jgi:sigma-54 dependent transcriptional regulator, acetoin dehydrogenase operon transcriptional activator AcoR
MQPLPLKPSIETSKLITYAPDLIWKARQKYFDNGMLPSNLLSDSVLQSWERCRQSGKSPNEHVEFDPVDKSKLAFLFESENNWLEIAKLELVQLAKAISDAGYVAMITNAHGSVLAVSGAFEKRCAPLRWAFRPGVDVSERSIGTSAMGLALAEGREVSVLGAEHFFSNNQLFHCYAVPIFDPRGMLLGSLDVTRDTPGFSNAVRTLTRQCATRIERRFFNALPVYLRLDFDTGSDASIAFNKEGQLIATNRYARKLLDLPSIPVSCVFEDIFEDRFEFWASKNHGKGNHQPQIVLKGGVCLAVQQTRNLSKGVTFVAKQESLQIQQPRLPKDIAFHAKLNLAIKAFNANLPILITGETGAGKEVTAATLHALGNRPNGPFVAFNCGVLPAELIASELFGHVEGAFTGSVRGGSIGKIEAASGGTVLLDEIGEMPLALQVALLRVLDTSEVLPVGGVKPRMVNVRFLCATNRNLENMVRDGHFRSDLYYRISGMQITVPPLRARQDFEDVLSRLCAKLEHDIHRISPDAIDKLSKLMWPGNVRQLQHLLKLAFAVGDEFSLLEFEFFQTLLGEQSTMIPYGKQLQKMHAPNNLIDEALKQCNGNVEAAAAFLGISRATFYRRRKSTSN